MDESRYQHGFSIACAHTRLIYAKHTKYTYMHMHITHFVKFLYLKYIIFYYNVIIKYDLNAMVRHFICVWLF